MIRRAGKEYSFRNCAGDPDPLPPDSPKKYSVAHVQELRDYSLDVLIAYKRTKMRGERLCTTILMKFRPHTIRSISHSSILEWFD